MSVSGDEGRLPPVQCAFGQPARGALPVARVAFAVAAVIAAFLFVPAA